MTAKSFFSWYNYLENLIINIENYKRLLGERSFYKSGLYQSHLKIDCKNKKEPNQKLNYTSFIKSD